MAVTLHQGGEVDGLLDLEQPVLVRCRPVPNAGLCPGLGGVGIRGHQQNILVQFGELGRIIAAQIDKEQFVGVAARRILGQRDIKTVGLSAGASAPEVIVNEIIEAFRARYNAVVELAETVKETENFLVNRELRSIELTTADMAFVNGE